MSHSVSECVDVAPLKGYHYLNEADLPGCNIACVYGGMMWADHALAAGIWPVNGSMRSLVEENMMSLVCCCYDFPWD